MNNADKIRAMTDEELAYFMSHSEFGSVSIGCPPTRHGCPPGGSKTVEDCEDCWRNWLKEEG